MRTSISRSGLIETTRRAVPLRRVLAGLAAVTLGIGGLSLTSLVSGAIPPAEAAGGRNMPANAGFDPSWKVMPGLQANWNDGSGTTAGTGVATSLNTNSVYFISDSSANNLGTVGATTWVLGEAAFSAGPDANGNYSYTTRGVMSITRTAAAPTGMPAYYPFNGANMFQQFDTIAVAPIGGLLDPQTANPDGTYTPFTGDPTTAPLTMYFWADPGTNHFNTSFLNCGAMATALGKPAAAGITVVRITSGDSNVYGGCAMAPSMGASFPPTVTAGYATGGEADQLTGLVYFDAMYGAFDSVARNGTGMNTSTQQFGIWDPMTGDYAQSGPVQPADLCMGAAYGCTVGPSLERNNLQYDPQSNTNQTPNVSADMGLDALGNIYQYATDGSAANAVGTGGATIIRVVPATDGSGHFVNGSAANPWRYNVVKKLTKATADMYIQSGEFAVGMGIHNGKLLAGGYYSQYSVSQGFPNCASVAACASSANPYAVNTTAGRMTQIDPTSGVMSVIGSTANASFLDNNPGTTARTLIPATSSPGGFRDNASPQMLTVIQGVIYNDANGDGAIDSSELGLSGMTVAIYNSEDVLVGTQTTDAAGEYAFIVSGNGTYTVRLVQPQISTASGVVNAVQTYGGIGDIPVGENTTTFKCVAQGNLTNKNGPCSGSLAAPYVDPVAGAVGSTADPATFPIAATVVMSDYTTVGEADFGITSVGSYGDAGAGPTTVATGAPMHLNGGSGSLYLGASVGLYAGPAIDNAAHNATDDGIFIQSYAGQILLNASTTPLMAATHQYTLGAQIRGTDAANGVATGWWTAPGGNAWGSGVWGPTGAPAAGSATAPFQIQSSGSITGTQTVQLRAQVSDKSAVPTLPTNANNEYQGTTSPPQYWVTPGEIEDYAIGATDAVYRVAAQTTIGSGTFTVDGQSITVPAAGQVVHAANPVAGTVGTPTTVSATTPDATWSVSDVVLRDTGSGNDVGSTHAFSWTPTASGANATFTPALGDDVTVEVTYEKGPDANQSTLTVDQTSTGIGQDITATATILDATGTPMSGQVITFATTGPVTFDPPATHTCTTVANGTCSVKVTSLTGGTYQVSATVPIASVDTPLKFSPVDITFNDVIDCAIPANAAQCVVDLTKSTFEVAPVTDPADPTFLNWPISDGTAHYTGTITLENSSGAKLAHMPMDDMAWVPSSSAVNAVKVGEVFGVGGALTGTYTGSFNTTTPGSAYTAQGEYGKGGTGFQPVGAPDVRPIPFKPGQGPCKYDPLVCNPDPTKSLFDVSPVASNSDTTNHTNWVVADGATPYNAKVTLMTDSGQPVYGAPLTSITLVPSATAVTATASASLIDDGAGNYLGTFVSATPGTYTAKAQYNGTDIGSPTITKDIPFIAGVECTYGVDPNCTPDVTKSDFTVAITAGSANPPLANGYDSYTGTVTLKTANGTLVMGYTPLTDIAFSPSTGVAATATAASAAHGQYTTTLTSEAASASYTVGASLGGAPIGPSGAPIILPIPFQPELQCNYDPVKCVPDPTKSLFSVAVPTGQVSPPTADGTQSWIGTVTLKKANGALVVGAPTTSITFQIPGTVSSSAPVAGANTGTYTTNFTSTSADPNYMAGASWAGTPIGPTGAPISLPIPFAGACQYVAGTSCVPDSTLSTFAVSPVANLADDTTWRQADGVQYYTATVTLRTAAGTPINGFPVTGIAFSPTAGAVASATAAGVGDGTYITHITSRAASATAVTGASYQEGSAAAQPIHAAATPPATGPLTLPVPFRPGPVDTTKSTFDVQPRSLNVNAPATATVTLVDANSNPVNGVTATFAVTPNTTTTFTPASAQCVTGSGSNPAGVCTVQVTDSKSETVNVSATIMVNTTPTSVGSAIAIQFGHGPVDPNHSSITVSPSTQKAGSPVTVSVTVHDAANNPIEDLASADFTITGTAAGLPDATWVAGQWAYSGSNGTYTRTATSTKPGLFTFGGTVTGVALNANHPADQTTFTYGDVCVSNCINTDPALMTRFEVGVNGSPANGAAANTIVAFAFDTYGNFVPNAPYQLTDQTSGATAGKLSPSQTSGAQTSPDGTGTSPFTTLVAGAYTVSGTFTTPLGNLPPTVSPSVGLNFIPGNASGGTIVIEQLNNLVGTTTYADITTTDVNGNLVGGVAVILTASSPNVALGSSAGTSTYTCTSGATGSPTAGTCKVVVTSKLAGNYTIAATVGGVALTGNGDSSKASPRPVNFHADVVCYTNCTPVDPSHTTHVLVTTNGALADTNDTNIVTAWAYDKYGNPVQNAKVWSTPLSAPNLTVGSPGTSANPALTSTAGVATIAYTSDLAATTQQATVLIQDPAAASPTEPKDPSGPSPVSMFFATGHGDPGHSSVAISPTTSQAVDSTFTITATVGDPTGNPVPGVAVNFTPDPGLTMTDAITGAPTTSCMTGDGTGGTTNGACQVKVTATKAATYNVAATIANTAGSQSPVQHSPVKATFTAGPICIAPACTPDSGVPTTGVSMTINDMVNDDTARDSALGEAYDRHGNPITGAIFQATTTDPITILPITPTTGGTTVIYFTSKNLTAGSFMAAVTVNDASGLPVAAPGSPLNVRFGTGLFDPGQSSFTVTPKVTGTPTPLTVGVDDVNTYTITATTKDAAGGPAGNIGVQFTLNPSVVPALTMSACVTDVTTGTCSITVYSTKAGTYAVTAAVGTTPFGGAKSAIWKADAVCAVGCSPVDPTTASTLRSRVVLTTNSATADGLSQDIATVWTFDKYGNPVSGVVVKATALSAGLTVESGILPTTASGSTTIWFTTTVAGLNQAHITVDTDNKEVAGGNPLAMTFVPGQASAAHSTLTVAPTTSPSGTAVVATLTARDQYDNLVPGVTGTFAVTGNATLAALTAPVASGPVTCTTSATTGASYGQCQVAVNDLKVETVTVTTTIPVSSPGTGTPVATLVTPTSGVQVTFTNACIPGIDPNCKYDPDVTNDHRTRVVVTANNQPIAGGTDVAQVWVFDQHGNPVAQAKVTATTANAQLVVPTGQPKLTDATGTVRLSFTTTAQNADLTAQAKVMITNAAGDAVEIVFQPQPGSSLDNPAGIAANSSPVTFTFKAPLAPTGGVVLDVTGQPAAPTGGAAFVSGPLAGAIAGGLLLAGLAIGLMGWRRQTGR